MMSIEQTFAVWTQIILTLIAIGIGVWTIVTTTRR
jgi:hypothetical protein